MNEKVTVRTFARRKAAGERITMLTAYDYTAARLADAAGVDAILVGDSLGMVIQGHPNTLPVTLDEMLYHTRCVQRGTRRALLVIDLPFASYRLGPEETLRSVCRAVQEAGAEAVKIEGGVSRAETIRAVVEAGVPVLGHVGMLPSYVHEKGFLLQGRDEASMRRVLEDAVAVEDAGAFAMVVENVTASLAAAVTARARIPTIGIGAGPHCDGQVLVMHDLLGLCAGSEPPFAQRYASLGTLAQEAIARYCEDVRQGRFPGVAQTRDLDPEGKLLLERVLRECKEQA